MEKKLANKVAQMMVAPEKYLMGSGLASPKNGYISPEARAKAKKEEKEKEIVLI